ncbi:hypothetical protein FVEG_17278 [Fusarium verticillioides 7600]|nr:hypothetical protein FVEG_17278 [Fusarium verticillioides 7600]XP_018760391.1 hypothetical protein FVEG_17278 [Fusarium verticillioides 7600]XP_018760392.1 hypothetical protein FVEG_17278 [Fusarium verticillioides 7600]EWG54199.1 hypothetical protein FVEG_17278 [Fusarium verticillioides 7600]EWG54200.1 hypothetical protein FVEG_17278 [Fusarium verticillioides 7600]EWG54201.1 hypothetical protein FVEG_17278 [Fusarium verticillioides 7600]
MRDRDTGSSRGYGYVSFDNSSQAESAITCANGKEIDGNCFTVKFASGRATPADGGGGPPRRYGGGGYDGGGYDGGG